MRTVHAQKHNIHKYTHKNRLTFYVPTDKQTHHLKRFSNKDINMCEKCEMNVPFLKEFNSICALFKVYFLTFTAYPRKSGLSSKVKNFQNDALNNS